MLFILAALAFLQITCIPGYIVLRYSKLSVGSILQKIVTIFALTLLINYLSVYLLTMLGIFVPTTVYFVLAMEIFLLVLTWKKGKKSKGKGLYIHFSSMVDWFKEKTKGRSPWYIVGFILSLFMIAVFIYIFLLRIKAVFYLNDPVLGWNRFALDWFQNRIPVNTWYYPQLIPANWSMAYVIMQNADLQLVARNIMPLFPLFTTFLFFDLGLRKREAVYFWALIFYSIIIFYFYSPEFIAGGHMDIPVAFFSFLSFYVLHLHHKDKPFQFKYSLLSIIFASTAAVTKQPGLYILIIILAWNIRLLFRANREHDQHEPSDYSTKKIVKRVIVMLLIIGVVVCSWYLYRTVLIQKGVESSGIKAVTQDVHHNRTYIERLEFGFDKILHARNRKTSAGFFVFLVCFFLLSSLFTRKARNVTLSIIIPFTLFWGLFYSYDYRNLTMVFPFLAFASAIGSQNFFRFSITQLHRLPKIRISVGYLLICLLPLLFILNFTLFKSESLLNNQLIQQRHVGNMLLNKKLYDYYEKHGFEGKVFSKYHYFRYLPELRDYWAEERSDEGVCYILEDFNQTRKDILKEIKQKINSGRYKILLSFNQYRLIKIK